MATLEDMPADIWRCILIDYKLCWFNNGSPKLSRCSMILTFTRLPLHHLFVCKAIYNAIKSCVFPVHIEEPWCKIHGMMSYVSGFTGLIMRRDQWSTPPIIATYYWNLLNSKLTGTSFLIETKDKKIFLIKFYLSIDSTIEGILLVKDNNSALDSIYTTINDMINPTIAKHITNTLALYPYWV